MKQIDIKKPKYIIPILILPFILGIGWLVKDMINSAPAEETTLVETEELNLDIPDANLYFVLFFVENLHWFSRWTHYY